MQVAVNGIISGLTIAVLALAFTAVYLPTRVFHIALAGIYAAVPFIAWAGLKQGWPWYLAAVTATLTGVTLSISCEVFNHQPLERKRALPGVHLVSSLGINMILVQAAALLWGNEPKILRTGLDTVLKTGDVVLSPTQLPAAAVALLLLAGFYVWLRFSNLGLQFRGLADNPVEMALRGHNVRRLRLLAFGISGLLASAASLTTAFDLGFNPYTGLPALLLAVVAMIIGGRQSFVGPVVGGLLLGLLRSEVVWFLSARWQEGVTFLLLGIFLLLRPEGLFGPKVRLEAQA
ncbi:MAG: branched-chain amino acid ABC transporter permease [Planctomycetes bacterium]|nr:branched-chain amino acid ABC transporter permease [Planctomycetota bacterium]